MQHAAEVSEEREVESAVPDEAGSALHATDEEKREARRRFFRFGAIAAMAAAVPGASAAAQPPARRTAQTRRVPRRQPSEFPTVEPYDLVAPPGSWRNATLRLVRRATLGLNLADAVRGQLMGYQGWLNEQVNFTRINDALTNSFVGTNYTYLAQTPEQIYNLDFGTLVNQLREATIYRAAFSRRQLYERMVEFWSDHFNIAIDKVGYLKLIDDRDVIRKYALGKFPDLVMASAKSPAMLAYLDQNLSRVGRPNENYARELMELHTLGVDGGYTQQDVVELSRVLTGWTLEGRGRFVFRPQDHDWGTKTVMGVTIPAGNVSMGQAGMQEGEQIIRMLVQHPNTERFIATKLLKWLLTPEPSETQIRTIASVYHATGGDIRLMVRAVLNSGWLAASPAKFKRPFHLAASALRALDPTVTSLSTIRGQLDAMGHQIHDWETPDGYPDKIEYWAGNIITRWSHATTVSNLNNASISVNMTPYLGLPSSGVVDAINDNLFGGEMSQSLRTALIGYLNSGTLNATLIREALALAMSSSEFQWY
jgi:uncharacterized protein (DUF1800 family)